MPVRFRFVFLAAITLAVLMPAGAVAATSVRYEPLRCAASARGRLIAAEPVARLDPAAVTAEIRSTARFGVDAYRITYCTISPTGAPIPASGLLALPSGGPRQPRVVLYEHGTIIAKNEAPSSMTGLLERISVLFLAADGFAVVTPDYLGLGLGPGRHPYGHAPSAVSASLDLLPAAEKVAARHRSTLSRDLFVTGFSQGGSVSMAAGKALQRGHRGWRIAALAPVAGPFDSLGALPALLDPAQTDQAKASAYLGYLLTAWKRLYRLYQDPAGVFTPAYAGIVEQLFDGTHGTAEVLAAMPATPDKLLLPRTLALVAHPTGRLAAALQDNETCRWAPAVPTRLYAGRADRDVPFTHAGFCLTQLTARGGRAELVDLGDVDHLTTALVALPQIRDWFHQLT